MAVMLSDQDYRDLEQILRAFRRGEFGPHRYRRYRATATGTKLRRAFCKTAAGAGSTIQAFLDTDTTGEEVTVNCDIDVTGTDLSNAFPTLQDGTPLTVYRAGGSWYCTTTFTANEDC